MTQKKIQIQEGESFGLPVTIFTLFRLKPGKKLWAFQQMGLAGRYLAQQEGIKFGLMLGTGQGRGFSLQPDFGRYALLTSWKSKKEADKFLSGGTIYKNIHQNSLEVFTTYLLPVAAKGNWKGQNPFMPLMDYPEGYIGPIVALTRASIRWQRLIPFWQHVPGVSKETEKVEGLLAQTGMGELPVIEQATLSIWQNESSLKAFAYQMSRHREVIQKTHSQHWYSEELFARFIPIEANGSWNGTNPLVGKCYEGEISLL